MTSLAEFTAQLDRCAMSDAEAFTFVEAFAKATPGDRRGDMRAVLRGELVGILDMVTETRRHRRPDVITKRLACPRNQ